MKTLYELLQTPEKLTLAAIQEWRESGRPMGTQDMHVAHFYDVALFAVADCVARVNAALATIPAITPLAPAPLDAEVLPEAALPPRPEPNVAAARLCGTDMYSGAQMLAYGRECAEAQRKADRAIAVERGRRDALSSAPADSQAQVTEADDEEESPADAWRRLALQFDDHRMQAKHHIQRMLENPKAHADAAREFLAAPPLSGEQVLAQRIEAIAEAQKKGEA